MAEGKRPISFVKSGITTTAQTKRNKRRNRHRRAYQPIPNGKPRTPVSGGTR